MNGLTSNKFNLRCGVRQGDPLSPLLYTISLEPLLKKINSSIKGLFIDNNFIKSRAFADDTVIALDDSDWPIFKKYLTLYELCSNAKVNNEKSKLICFSTLSTPFLQKIHPFIPNNSTNPIIFLGVNIINQKYNYYST